jgi:hypothetical protein
MNADDYSDLEYRDERKAGDPLFFDRMTGEPSVSFGQFARAVELGKYVSSPKDSFLKRVYFALRRFAVNCTPESVYHTRREEGLVATCGLD